MSWSYVQGTTGHTVTSSLTLQMANSVVNGNLIVATFTSFNTSVNTVTVGGDAGEVFSPMSQIAANSVNVEVWSHLMNTTRGLQVTFNQFNFVSAVINEFMPSSSPSTDGNSSSNGSSNSTSTGNIPVTGLDLVFASFGSGGATGTVTPSSGYTAGNSVAYSAGNNMGIATQYKLGATSTENPGATFNTSAPWSAVGVSFRIPNPPSTQPQDFARLLSQM